MNAHQICNLCDGHHSDDVTCDQAQRTARLRQFAFSEAGTKLAQESGVNNLLSITPNADPSTKEVK